MNRDRTTLPLLDYVSAASQGFDLSKTLLITCQHILEDHLILFDYLFDHGLEPSNVYWLGKSYSTNQHIAAKLTELGIFIHPASEHYDSHRAFDDQHAEATKNLFTEIESRISYSDYEQIMIIDDGAQLLLEASQRLQDVDQVVAVEWTSAGYHRLHGIDIAFPIVNMARSEAKLKLESPFIAQKAVDEFKKYVAEQQMSIKSILVIGGGYIGTNIASLLKTNFRVQQYDVLAHLSDFNDEALHTLLPDYDAVIGSTGQTVITPNHFSLLKKNVVLASSSSSDREFSAVDLRRQVAPNNNPHAHLIVNDIHLLNSGFPVTFDGSARSISLDKIQLTMALAFASMAQAQKESHRGLVPLAEATQQKIVDKFALIS